MPDCSDEFHQTVIAGMGRAAALGFVSVAVLAVVIMQTSELNLRIVDRPNEIHDLRPTGLIDSRSIHAGVKIQINPDPRADPLAQLFLILRQHGNAHPGELLRDLADTSRIGAHHWIGHQNIGGPGFAGSPQFQSCGTFKVPDSSLQQHLQGIGQLRGLDVRAPAVRIAAEKLKGGSDVGCDNLRIKQERWRKHFSNVGETISLGPGEIANDGLRPTHGSDHRPMSPEQQLTTSQVESRLSIPKTMAAPEDHRPDHPHLVRGLGLLSAVAIVVGDTIGTGVFLVSSDMARATGSVTRVLAAWVIAGIIVLFGAFCYAELGAVFPRAGGPYVYLSRGLGPLWGFLFGWMSSFLDRPVAMATLAAGFVRFLSFIFPALSQPWFHGHLGNYQFIFTTAQPLAALVVVIATALNYFSVRMSGAVQILVTIFKVGTILAIVIGGAAFGSRMTPVYSAPVAPLATFGSLGALLTALVPAMWAYNGFNDLGNLGEEIVDPQKNIPRAILGGLLIIAGLYLTANVVYFHVLPFASVASSEHVASDVVQLLWGPLGARWLTIAMAVSALGALHVVILTGARIPYAMARDKVFFRFAERIDPSFHTPSGSLLFLGFVASVLALTGTFEELYSLFVFAVWIFFALTAIALLRLRKNEPDLNRPYRVWGYPWTPLVFLLAAIALTVNLWMVRPVRSSIGLLVILAGIPFYFRWGSGAGTDSGLRLGAGQQQAEKKAGPE